MKNKTKHKNTQFICCPIGALLAHAGTEWQLRPWQSDAGPGPIADLDLRGPNSRHLLMAWRRDEAMGK